jgi:hypothetical protein
MTMRLLLMLSLAVSFAAAPLAHAAVKPATHAAHKTTTKKTPHKTARQKKAEDPKAKTEAALREQTDSFVTLINDGKQSLTDAQIAWKAKHPQIACQRARAAKVRFDKARLILDGMVKTADDGKADTAPFKALYPKTDELAATTRKLIGMTCAG